MDRRETSDASINYQMERLLQNLPMTYLLGRNRGTGTVPSEINRTSAHHCLAACSYCHLLDIPRISPFPNDPPEDLHCPSGKSLTILSRPFRILRRHPQEEFFFSDKKKKTIFRLIAKRYRWESMQVLVVEKSQGHKGTFQGQVRAVRGGHVGLGCSQESPLPPNPVVSLSEPSRFFCYSLLLIKPLQIAFKYNEIHASLHIFFSYKHSLSI